MKSPTKRKIPTKRKSPAHSTRKFGLTITKAWRDFTREDSYKSSSSCASLLPALGSHASSLVKWSITLTMVVGG